jgi:hypothetical protein
MRRLLWLVLTLSAVLVLPVSSRAQSPDPRDYEVGYFVPNGTKIINAYLRDASATRGRDYSAQALALRATYILKLGDLVITPFDMILPVQNVTGYTSLSSLNPAFAAVPSDLKLTAHASGVGDLVYLPTIGHGITQNAENHTHTWYALTAYITAPTGSYNANSLLNVGGNRWVFNPLVTVGQRFLRAFTLEANANLAFYTKNTEYRVPVAALAGRDLELKQTPSFGAAVHVAADLHQSFFVGLSYLLAMNGKRTFDLPTGMEMLETDKSTVHTLRLNFGFRVTPQTLLLAQWNEDVAGSNNAVRGRFIGLRITHAFFTTPGQAPQSRPAPTSQPAAPQG